MQRIPFVVMTTFLFASSLLLFPSMSEAQSDGLRFHRVPKNGVLVLRRCPLVEGVRKIRVIRQGARVQLPLRQKRRASKLGRRYRFFACETNEQGVTVLYAKARKRTEVVTLPFTLADFAERRSGGNNSGGGSPGLSACRSNRSWPSSHIYKTIGSEHFSDVRRNTIGIVVRPGGSGPFPSCVNGYDKNGNLVVKLGLWSRNDGWAARYYAGIGCGTSTALNGAKVAQRARANTGNDDVIFEFDGVCFGPIDADRCIGSAQC